MTDKEKFEDLLRQNEDDDLTRAVFADWLDDHGFPDEATRHRNWRAAKDWLTGLVPQLGEQCLNYGAVWREDAEMETRPFTYEDVIAAGYHVLSAGYGLIQHGDDTARDLFQDKATRREFWRCWQIVTGEVVPEGNRDDAPFGCSC